VNKNKVFCKLSLKSMECWLCLGCHTVPSEDVDFAWPKVRNSKKDPKRVQRVCLLMFVDVFPANDSSLRLPFPTFFNRNPRPWDHGRSWIAENGGFTHPSLRISCGARGRGVVAAEPLSSAELCRLPWRLLISEQVAEESLSFGRDLRMSAEVEGSWGG
jgi:hypothetical protein